MGVNVIFDTFGMGFQTSRDAWLYNFNENALSQNVKRTSDFYNTQVLKWKGMPQNVRNVDDFVEYDDTKIKWSSGLKLKLQQGRLAEFPESKLRMSLCRPFHKNESVFRWHAKPPNVCVSYHFSYTLIQKQRIE